MTDLTGRTVVVTGASSGIGAATCHAYGAAGANVVLLARREEKVAEIAGDIGADRALAVPCDVSRYWEVEAAIDAALATFGSLDVLVNNAGVIEPIARLNEAEPEAWSQSVDVNLKGVFHGIRAALPVMLGKGGGTILNVSSGAASGPVEAWSQYCASKAGAAMLLRCVHHEFGDNGIRAIGLSPGTVATDMQRQIRASGTNPVSRIDWEDHVPAEWPARALVWLSGPDADEFAGQEVSLRDEGIRARAGLV
jgi:NAD(P)-dependent dehydrogenase (short-subunit alcohol dehydrogenase family)